MGLNPTTEKADQRFNDIIGLAEATVIDANAHTQGDGNGHYVLVEGDMFEGQEYAEVLVTQKGDTNVPTQGDGVIVGYRRNGEAIVLGRRYSFDETVPDFVPGERRISAEGTDSNVTIAPDGTITLTAHGTTVQIDTNGDVIVDDGSTQAITNVEAANTNSYGGITSLDITRSPSVYIPSP